MDDTEIKAAIYQMRKKRRKGLFSKLTVCLVFLSIFAYTAACLWLSYKAVIIPDSLTIAFFAAMVGEFSALGVIKAKKIKRQKGEEENDERFTELH